MEDVLRKLEARLGAREGEPEALEDGITNRNYRVRFGGRDHVVRICGAQTELLGIDREAEQTAAAAAHAAGVGPEVTAFLHGDSCLVTAFVQARSLEPADVQEDVVRVAAALRTVHHSHTVVHATFSPFRVAERYRELTLERGGGLPEALGPAAAAARRIEEALPPFKPALCHNDLLPANLLDDGERLWIIDWEYAAMGDPFFDLGNLSAMNGFELHDDTALVTAYLGHCDEPDLARVRLHRAAAEYREGMWGVVQ
ncbi:MAG: phosphotransferase, partial [Solirubrobacterales bacterium]|nr:phosphotransferase [Solirubrobacterales bacterium]